MGPFAKEFVRQELYVCKRIYYFLFPFHILYILDIDLNKINRTLLDFEKEKIKNILQKQLIFDTIKIQTHYIITL